MPLIKTLALTDPSYQFLFSDGNGNVLGGPVIEQLPTENIGSALVAYLLQNEVISGYFNNIPYSIVYYDRQDYGERTGPGIAVYPESDTYEGTFGWLTARFVTKVSFPLTSKREYVVDTCKRLCDYLSLVLNGTNCINFVRQYSLGLVTVSFNNAWDYSQSISSEGQNKLDIYVAKGVGEYRVSMLEYYEGLGSGDLYKQANIKVIPV